MVDHVDGATLYAVEQNGAADGHRSYVLTGSRISNAHSSLANRRKRNRIAAFDAAGLPR